VVFEFSFMSTSQEQTPLRLESSILEALQQLIDVVAQLRSPNGGCPWDLAQTPQTLLPYVIEEAYEVVDAIQSGDKDAITEELGDLLLQVVLQAQIATEADEFTLKEVAQGITQKLIRRHPHVFGDVEVQGVEDVRQNWEQIKAAEKGETATQTKLLSRKLDRYARTLPPLTAGMKISQKAAEAGFEWEDIEGVWAKFHEELAEFQASLEEEDKAHQQAELGDILFTLINLARWYELDPTDALQGTNRRFVQRLAKMETICDRPLGECSVEELDQFWQQAKAQLAKE
jgi:XTP/dITP diphosphohydrolase